MEEKWKSAIHSARQVKTSSGTVLEVPVGTCMRGKLVHFLGK